MKLYNHSLAPNPRRVRIIAAEKGIKLTLEEVDILAGKSRTPEFLAKNSSGRSEFDSFGPAGTRRCQTVQAPKREARAHQRRLVLAAAREDIVEISEEAINCFDLPWNSRRTD